MNTARFALYGPASASELSELDMQAMNELLSTRFSKKGWTTSPEKLKAFFDDGGVLCVVRDFENGQKIVSIACLVVTPEIVGPSCGLGYVGTAESLEGQGLARAAILYLHDRARELKLPSISLGVRYNNDRAIALYESLGYVRLKGYKYRLEFK
ncbi:MAG: GNAT family N-acetyltransferase [bacterium]|nr:GNAT family N-acetyltransferase [bacterium]